MELQGKIIAALPERSGVSARGEWKSQDFVVETIDGQYTRKMLFTVFGADRLQRFNIQVGQDVLVSFDIDCHEWNGRWYNDIRAYDVRLTAPGQNPAAQNPFATEAPAATPITPSTPAQSEAPAPQAPFENSDGDADNLPF